jgi:hypothetical protein
MQNTYLVVLVMTDGPQLAALVAVAQQVVLVVGTVSMHPCPQMQVLLLVSAGPAAAAGAAAAAAVAHKM